MAAFVSFWFLSVLGGSWHFLKTLHVMAKHVKSIARRVRLAALGCPRIALPISSGHAALVVQNGRQKFIEHLIKIIQNSIGNHENSIPNRPQERSKSDLGSKAFPERFLVPPSYTFLVGFWRHLGDFGRLLGTSWAPRGSQNLPFWYEDAPKCRKMRSRMRHQKKYEFLIKFRSENVRF